MRQGQEKYLSRFLYLFSILIFAITILLPHNAHANSKYSSIIINADTGQVLSERYADKVLHPASLTKMMTLYMAFDALKQNKLSKNQRLWVSPHATTMPPSKLGLKPRSTIKTNDVILSLVTKSANDAAVVLAEAIAGSEIRFARLMTKKAQELGMSRTVFKNASGLHNRQQVSSARDMSILAQALLRDHPKYYHYFSTKKFSYKGHTYKNHNRLMTTYKGMDGIKTGYIRASGFNLVTSAKRGDERLIGVVFGGKSTYSRNKHMEVIMNKGFSRNERIRIASMNHPIPKRKPAPYLRVASVEKTKNASQKYIENVAFSNISEAMGEGDIDEDLIELLAKSFFKNKKDKVKTQEKNWGIQIGSYKKPRQSYNALDEAQAKLPSYIARNMTKKVIPVPTKDGVFYRAQLSGLDQKSAKDGCKILKSCIILSSK